MKRDAANHVFNFTCITVFTFKEPDPETGKPLCMITGLLDGDGNELPPFWITCNLLVSVGKGAELAMLMWEAKSEGE